MVDINPHKKASLTVGDAFLNVNPGKGLSPG